MDLLNSNKSNTTTKLICHPKIISKERTLIMNNNQI